MHLNLAGATVASQPAYRRLFSKLGGRLATRLFLLCRYAANVGRLALPMLVPHVAEYLACRKTFTRGLCQRGYADRKEHEHLERLLAPVTHQVPIGQFDGPHPFFGPDGKLL